MSVVLDIGSDTCRAGFSGEKSPRVQFPTIVGRTRMKGRTHNYGSKQDVWVGDEALAIRGTLSIKYPVEWGVVTNWEDYDEVLTYTFYRELNTSVDDRTVLFAEPVMNPRANREKITQIMFEKYEVNALFLVPQAVLSLFSAGRSTGLVVESTAAITHFVPIYEGHVLPYAVMKLPFGGSDVQWKLHALLQKICSSDFLNRYVLQDIKHKLAYVALDYDAEVQKTSSPDYKPEEYELPDGNLVTVGAERFECTEILFQPKEMELPGIHEVAFNCIKRCNSDLQEEMCSNIVLSGGNTLFPGFIERFRKEMTSLVGDKMNVSVNAAPDGLYSPWVGGSILALLPTFDQMVMTLDEYNEHGPSFITKKCF